MVACRYGMSLLVFNSKSYSFVALTSELPGLNIRGELESHIHAHQCFILKGGIFSLKQLILMILFSLLFLSMEKKLFNKFFKTLSCRNNLNQKLELKYLPISLNHGSESQKGSAESKEILLLVSAAVSYKKRMSSSRSLEVAMKTAER